MNQTNCQKSGYLRLDPHGLGQLDYKLVGQRLPLYTAWSSQLGQNKPLEPKQLLHSTNQPDKPENRYDLLFPEGCPQKLIIPRTSYSGISWAAIVVFLQHPLPTFLSPGVLSGSALLLTWRCNLRDGYPAIPNCQFHSMLCFFTLFSTLPHTLSLQHTPKPSAFLAHSFQFTMTAL